MNTQITSGIKISVATNFEGNYYKDYAILYAFSYEITIENLSTDIVQLQSRHWDIFDSLNFTESVDGEGVVGQTPIIIPGDKYVYSSGCMLHSTIGAMKGFYTMLNFTTSENFEVQVPTFKLNVPFAIN
ncbi:Co2+/Mg2+ efflux protein ApaG [Flavobacterium difficile]|uniref:Co2+/Mg2+ efflux protein ApaG n=1 Tax=Flavobacterium difficile TaxID=2709659 RepID=A0ABX0I3L8_9FLAO|nr:Co2+/Mg2+ efflux protein ApaG [Flavobacterium difficile]NHM01785.1 Co2+/Mg2+ efflux protein ApaG [Flavobacterium difficile]